MYGFCGHIGLVKFESCVTVKESFAQPGSVSETLNTRITIPFRVLGVVDIQAERLVGVIASTTHEHHAAVHEDSGVLIAALR